MLARGRILDDLAALGDAEGARRELRIHYSQLGEDVVLWHYLKDVWDGFYVDIGAHDPFRYSNTALLHLYRRWSGINVDFSSQSIEKFVASRPQDINICAAVSDKNERVLATRFRDGAVSTLDAGIASRQQERFVVDAEYEVETVTLASLLSTHVPAGRSIDLLSIDVEGFDHKVLLGNDWGVFRPKYIAIELHHFDLDRPSDNASYGLLRSLGYGFVSKTIATAIFRSKAAPS